MKNITKVQAIPAYPGIIQAWLFSREKPLSESTTELCHRAFALGFRPIDRVLSTSAVSRWRRSESKVPMWAISVVIPDLLACGWRPQSAGEWATVAQGLLAHRLQQHQFELSSDDWQKHYHKIALSEIDDVISEHPELEKSTLLGWLNSVASDGETTLSSRQARDISSEGSDSE